MTAPLGLTLPLQIGANGYFQTTTNIQAQVRSNLIHLLMTQIGEIPLNPTFGSTLTSLLFNFQNDNTSAEIQASVESAVQTWMPFITINTVTTAPSTFSNQSIVSINYTLNTTNTSDIIQLVL